MCGKERRHRLKFCAMVGRVKLGRSAGRHNQVEDRPPIRRQTSHQTIRGFNIHMANTKVASLEQTGVWELWHIKYDDGDEEDVDTHDRVRMLMRNTTKPEARGEVNKLA